MKSKKKLQWRAGPCNSLTKDEARALVDAHEIRLEDGDEETEMLREANPELFEAYERILKIAHGE